MLECCDAKLLEECYNCFGFFRSLVTVMDMKLILFSISELQKKVDEMDKRLKEKQHELHVLVNYKVVFSCVHEYTYTHTQRERERERDL